jgi:hypothetical protein
MFPSLPRELALRGGPSWLTWELVATPSARIKLFDWIETAPAPWWEAATMSRDEALQWIDYAGDTLVLGALLDVLAAVPRPVAEHVTAACNIVGTGAQTWGMCALPSVPRPWTVTVSPGPQGDLAHAVIAHELAHVWLLPRPGADQRRPSVVEDLARASLRVEHCKTEAQVAGLRRFRSDGARDEAEADALAASWGFPVRRSEARRSQRRKERQ